ncbi:hypothetical protein SAMN05519105_4016 [Rhodobacter sp. 24-YEA-8]|nr:hypothetical protein SAMN05519105_4016 [Rhodobacter sp. 24-YEA-8]
MMVGTEGTTDHAGFPALWVVSGSEKAGGNPVVAVGSETFDAGEFDKPPCGTATGKDGDEVDGLRDHGARNGDNGFLDELFEAAQRADAGTGMDGADAAGWPVPQALRRSSASAPRTSPIGMRSGRRCSDERTRSDRVATPSLVRIATRLGAAHCNSRVSSMMTTRSAPFATSESSALVRDGPRMGMTKRDPKRVVSTSFDRRSSMACKYRKTAVATSRALREQEADGRSQRDPAQWWPTHGAPQRWLHLLRIAPPGHRCFNARKIATLHCDW